MSEYRVRFSKRSSLKYLSHLELIKAVERSLRRAGLPLAYSEGFHPHPKLSFGPALAVGISSIDEYFDLELNEKIDPQTVLERLNAALPQGIQVEMVKACQSRVKALNAIINRASYLILLTMDSKALPDVISQLNQLMSKDSVEVTRINKNGQKVVNIRPWLHNLKIEILNESQLQLKITGELGSQGNLRPEDIVRQINYPVQTVNIARVGLWHEEKESLAKPMELC